MEEDYLVWVASHLKCLEGATEDLSLPDSSRIRMKEKERVKNQSLTQTHLWTPLRLFRR